MQGDSAIKTKKLRLFIRKYADWIIAVSLLVIVGTGLLIGLTVLNKDYYSGNGDFIENTPNSEPNSSYTLIPPDAKYPPPATTQFNFNETYNVGSVDFHIQWLRRNIERNPDLSGHVFRIVLYNNKNKPVTLDSSQTEGFTVGCIATDKPYTTKKVQAEAFSFEPFEIREMDIAVGIDCLYLGTADGNNFWRIY